MIFHHFETLIPQDFLTKSTGAFQLELLLTMLIERDGRLVNRKTTFSNNGEIPSNRKNILTPNFNPHKELFYNLTGSRYDSFHEFITDNSPGHFNSLSCH